MRLTQHLNKGGGDRAGHESLPVGTTPLPPGGGETYPASEGGGRVLWVPRDQVRVPVLVPVPDTRQLPVRLVWRDKTGMCTCVCMCVRVCMRIWTGVKVMCVRVCVRVCEHGCV